MPIGQLKDLVLTCPHNTPLLGLDLGTRTIGLSVCDPAQTLATPLKTLKRTRFTEDMQTLHAHIKAYEIGGIILGYPLHMDGRKSPACDRTESFAKEMHTYLTQNTTQKQNENENNNEKQDWWIAFWDERLSTSSAYTQACESANRALSLPHAKNKGHIDSLAARIILETGLDFIRTWRDQQK